MGKESLPTLVLIEEDAEKEGSTDPQPTGNCHATGVALKATLAQAATHSQRQRKGEGQEVEEEKEGEEEWGVGSCEKAEAKQAGDNQHDTPWSPASS